MTGELSPGDPAPPFRLPRLDGTGTLKGPEPGALTLLLFTKESCPTCRWALPHFRTLHERVGEEHLAVRAVAQGDPDAERDLVAETGVAFPVATEESPWPTSASYGLTTVPTFFLIDGDGKVLLTSRGFARDELLEAARRATGRDDAFPEGKALPAFRPG